MLTYLSRIQTYRLRIFKNESHTDDFSDISILKDFSVKDITILLKGFVL